MTVPNFTTVEEFVAWEERQDEKFEFADGDVSLFPGGTARHEIIVANLIVALRAVAGPSAVRGSGMKQLTRSSSRYADVSVTNDPRDAVDLTFARYPTLLIEVLSPSTERWDRGAKFDEYRTIETLEEYVLVDSRKRWVQTIRLAGGEWIVSLPVLAGSVAFTSLPVNVSFDELYAGTELP